LVMVAKSKELERVERLIADLADQGRPSRTLGLVVLRGPNIALISPTDGSAGKLANIFLYVPKLTSQKSRTHSSNHRKANVHAYIEANNLLSYSVHLNTGS